MENERQIEQVELTNQLLLDMVKNQKTNMNNLFRVYITTLCCYTIILVAMIIGFFVYESQLETESTITTTTETITQEVTGNDSSINNVEGDQYNDSATHNE